MTETKMIDPAALATITTGVVLVVPFSIVHEAIDWIMGRHLWTHELVLCGDETKALVLEQFPDMPTDFTGDIHSLIASLRAHYGETVAVKQGATKRTASPIDTLADMVGDTGKTIPVIV